MKPFGLYVDFPFCRARCGFCAFNIQGYREGPAERYASALHKELELYAGQPALRNRTMTSIYFGGGTPSLYPPGVLTTLLSSCRNLFDVAPDAEVTLEAHPATLHPSNLLPLREGGINRLSMGVQSFSDPHLEALGRHHTADEARGAFRSARDAGFTNIGIDLIYALPGQNLKEWEETLREAVALSPEHLSLYCLSIEEGTLFDKKARMGLLSPPFEEDTILFYRTARSLLRKAGYEQYEISNFARSGYRCKQNLLYWNRDESIGVGLSAHAYFDLEYRANTDSLPAYLDRIEAGQLPISQVEKISPEEARKDRIVFGLRKSEGIPLELVGPEVSLRQTAERLIRQGLLSIDGERLQLTSEGMLLADEVAVAFL